MAKGNRKRTKKPKPEKKEEKVKTIYEEFPAKTLGQNDATRMKEIFTLSNNVAALIKDYAEKEIAIKNMRKMADTIQEEKEPLQVQVAKNMFKTERNYNEVAKDIRKQADTIEKSLVLIHGQIEHRYEDYVSTLARLRSFIDQILSGEKNRSITGHRSTPEVQKEEEILFEKEFDQLSEDDKKQLIDLEKEISKKKKEAKKDGKQKKN